MRRRRTANGRYGWSSPLAAILLVASAAIAATPPAGADGWRTAPLFGADVRALAFHPASADRVLAGTSAGQVYESLDAGLSWHPAGDRVAFPGWVVSELVFDELREGRVWAALWSLWGSDGAVAVSSDGGRSWSDRSGDLPAKQVYTLAIAPDRPDTLYAATRDGVWSTGDAGRSWRRLTTDLPRIGKVTSLLVDPYDPAVLYAGSWRRAYRSDDHGATWKGIFNGMVLDSEVFALVPGPGGEGDLWASTCGWVYHGSQRGRRWQRHTSGLTERRTQSFAVLPSGRLLAGTVAGVFASDDRGRSWRRRGAEVAVTAFAVHADRPAVVLHGSEGAGVWRSTDGGRSFERSSAGLVGVRVTDVVAGDAGVSISIRDSEGRDGVHHLSDGDLAPAGHEQLPPVLALASDGGRLFAASEAGLWRRSAATWERVEEFGTERVNGVSAAGGWVVAHERTAVLATHGSTVWTVSLPGPVSQAVYWNGFVWIVDAGALLRWDFAGLEEVPAPSSVRRLSPGSAGLAVETQGGLYRFDGAGNWLPTAVESARLLPTGNASLPALALAADGTATLLDGRGRERAAVVLPVPWREVSAALLAGDRLHLATAGYGLLWSQLVTLDAEPDDRPAPRISSR